MKNPAEKVDEISDDVMMKYEDILEIKDFDITSFALEGEMILPVGSLCDDTFDEEITQQTQSYFI